MSKSKKQSRSNIDSKSEISDDEFQAKEEERKHKRHIERSETKIKSAIALLFSIGFLSAIIIPSVSAAIGFLGTEDLDQVILILSSAISGPFGFIMGYYYR